MYSPDPQHSTKWASRRINANNVTLQSSGTARVYNKCFPVAANRFSLTSTCLSLCTREAASSSFFSRRACPSSAARIRSGSSPPPLSQLPGGDVDGGSVKDRDTDEDEDRGKKESSRLGEGRLVFLGVNILDGLTLLDGMKVCQIRTLPFVEWTIYFPSSVLAMVHLSALSGPEFSSQMPLRGGGAKTQLTANLYDNWKLQDSNNDKLFTSNIISCGPGGAPLYQRSYCYADQNTSLLSFLHPPP